MTLYSRVEAPWWDDRDLYVIGGGPSLRGRDLSRLYERGRVLGVNRAADHVPCHAVFSLDTNFIAKRRDWLTGLTCTTDVFLAVPEDWTQFVPGATHLRRQAVTGLSEDPTTISNGLNSGYGAVNLATLKRARRIYLLGFDLVAPERNGPRHWHDGYPWETGSSVIYYKRWADKFYPVAADCERLGIEVVNANPASAIKAFPFTTYEELGL